MSITHAERERLIAERLAAALGLDYQEYLGAFTTGYERVCADRAACVEGEAAAGAFETDAVTAAAKLVDRAWDREVFGFPVAAVTALCGDTVEAQADVLRELIADAARRGVRLMTARVAAGNIAAIQALEAAGFRHVDSMNILLADLRKRERGQNTGAPEGIAIRPLAAEHRDAAAALCAKSFDHSRVSVDSHFTAEQKRAFFEALAGSFVSRDDAVVQVALEGERVVGAIAGAADEELSRELADRVGYLWLLAVDGSARGRGVGAALVEHFLDAMAKDVALVEVGTQTTNVEALNLYARTGFRFVAALLTFHLWLDPATDG